LALLALGCTLLPGGAGAVPEDEIVPEGVWGVRLMFRSETQDSTIDRGGRNAKLINYVIPEDDIRAEVDGQIERSIRRHDVLLTYGISDSWNLSLNVPYLEMEQDSSLTSASADPEVQAAVARLQSESLSGLGELTLTSLHRPVFSDWNSLVMGYGLNYPAGGQEQPYVGSNTFALHTPVASVFGLVHYTRYPAINRSRFDVRGWVALSLTDDVTTAQGDSRKLEQGNRVSIRAGWSQEIGSVSAGLEVEILDQRNNTLGGERLSDRLRAQFLRLHVGFGNLAELESGPMAFPYQFNIQFESLQRGTNVPDGDNVSLIFQTYF
jgi:hypothetical protein